jgi:hypothetical protein
MITFLGIIIFAIPFASVVLFKDKMIGFFSVFTVSFLLHFLIALTTQVLGLFKYEVIIPIYLVIGLSTLIFVYFKHPYKKSSLISCIPFLSSITKHTWFGSKESRLVLFKRMIVRWVSNTKNKQKFLVAIAFTIVFFNLFSVHYNFTGTVNSHDGSYQVENSSNIYPYFSDEWVAISFVKYAIETHSIPAVNPLTESEKYNNPLVPYFSFLADIFLFFGFDPLGDFELVNLLVGMSTCIAFFALLISLGLDKRVSILSVLIVPYITNGGNLPGIWFLIPMTFALVFYLISLIGFAKGNNTLLALSSFLTICLYPPFIVFVAPVLLVLVFRNKGIKIKTALLAVGVLFLALIIVGSIVFSRFSLPVIVDTLRFYFFRTNLVGGYLSFPIWVVLPLFVLPLSVFGFLLAIKRRLYFIIIPLSVGLIYWLLYVKAERVLIIDYPRIVVITSFLVLIVFALALDYFIKGFVNEKYKNIITAMCVLIALILSFTYTENDSWRGLKLHSNRDPDDVMLNPAPTASIFLTDEDLALFSDITKKRFISPPWKGLVISAATGNYPMTSKPSTIGVFTLNYDWFADTKCEEKDTVSIEHNVSYAYSRRFDCPNFTEIGESSEGLVLYKFNRVD